MRLFDAVALPRHDRLYPRPYVSWQALTGLWTLCTRGAWPWGCGARAIALSLPWPTVFVSVCSRVWGPIDCSCASGCGPWHRGSLHGMAHPLRPDRPPCAQFFLCGGCTAHKMRRSERSVQCAQCTVIRRGLCIPRRPPCGAFGQGAPVVALTLPEHGTQRVPSVPHVWLQVDCAEKGRSS